MNEQWTFTGPRGDACPVNIPHTWNAVDGQDGGNDYWRGTCTYEKDFAMPGFDPVEDVYLEFQGVNASADVELNGHPVLHHNGVNDRVYPQKADFTFYGGIYRDVELVVVNKHRFSMDHFGGPGLKVTPVWRAPTARCGWKAGTTPPARRWRWSSPTPKAARWPGAKART